MKHITSAETVIRTSCHTSNYESDLLPQQEEFSLLIMVKKIGKHHLFITYIGFMVGGNTKDAGFPPEELHLLAALSSVLAYTILSAKKERTGKHILFSL